VHYRYRAKRGGGADIIDWKRKGRSLREERKGREKKDGESTDIYYKLGKNTKMGRGKEKQKKEVLWQILSKTHVIHNAQKKNGLSN